MERFSTRVIVVFCSIFVNLHTISSEAGVQCKTPTNFPPNIELETKPYENWALAIKTENILTANPKSAGNVALLANWAVQNGYTLRARGFMHNWSPLVVTPAQASCGNVVLLDTTKYLTSMQMVSTGSPASVQTQTGASLENLLTFWESRKFGLPSHPAPGDVSIGGVIAVDGHGSGVPLTGTTGTSYGSISNLVISLDAVVWNGTSQAYQIQTFDRSNPETKALITNLGRIFLTQVTLRVVPSFNMRCISRTDISVKELFADPATVNSSTRTFSKLLEASGSVETILFPFTTRPWTKTWSVSPQKSLRSRPVSSPYNYPFSDNIPLEVSKMAEQMLAGQWHLAPAFGKLAYTISTAGLLLLSDLWGPAKNLQLYVKPTTLRVTANGYAVLTSRANIQLVISRFYSFYETLLQKYADDGLYPINGPLEIRVSGLDNPDSIGILNAEAPTLSALKPVEGRPDLNAAVWIDCLTFPTTPGANQFLATIEDFLFNSFNAFEAVVRSEWSKGWAYTNSSAWLDAGILTETIPKLYGAGSNGNGWSWAISIFNKYDPQGVFSNEFLNSFLK